MMWGSFGLAISMMLIAVLLSFTQARGYTQKLNKATSSASVAFFFTYVSRLILSICQTDTDNALDVHLRSISELYSMVSFATVSLLSTALTDPRVYVPEILPLHARAKGTAIGISSNWLWVSSLHPHHCHKIIH